MKLRMFVIVAVLAITAGSSTAARAEWLVTPFAGANFGGRTADAPRIDYGAAFGWAGEGPFGFEVDLSRSPNFFRAEDVSDVIFSKSSVTALMFNATVGWPGAGRRFRPYVSAGAGLIRSQIGTNEDFIRGTSNNFGIDAGAGVTWMFGARFGARGDLRYFRDLQELRGDSEFFSFGSANLDYWRSAAGLVLSF